MEDACESVSNSNKNTKIRKKLIKIDDLKLISKSDHIQIKLNKNDDSFDAIILKPRSKVDVLVVHGVFTFLDQPLTSNSSHIFISLIKPVPIATPTILGIKNDSIYSCFSVIWVSDMVFTEILCLAGTKKSARTKN